MPSLGEGSDRDAVHSGSNDEEIVDIFQVSEDDEAPSDWRPYMSHQPSPLARGSGTDATHALQDRQGDAQLVTASTPGNRDATTGSQEGHPPAAGSLGLGGIFEATDEHDSLADAFSTPPIGSGLSNPSIEEQGALLDRLFESENSPVLQFLGILFESDVHFSDSSPGGSPGAAFADWAARQVDSQTPNVAPATTHTVMLQTVGFDRDLKPDDGEAINDIFQDALDGSECHAVVLAGDTFTPQVLNPMSASLSVAARTIRELDIRGIVNGRQYSSMDEDTASLTAKETFCFVASHFAKSGNLECVHAGGNRLGDLPFMGLEPLFKNCNVAEWRFGESDIGDDSVIAFSNARLSTAGNLTILTFGKNENISEPGTKAMGKLLTACTGLHVFSFVPRELCTDEGTRALVQGLFASTCNSLVKLVLAGLRLCSHNDVESTQALCRVLERSLGLCDVSLRRCHLISLLNVETECVESILRALNRAALRRFEFGGNCRWGVDVATCLADFVTTSQARWTLRYLSLEGSGLRDAGVQVVVPAIARSCKELKVLVLANNDIKDNGANTMLNHPIKTLRLLDVRRNLISSNALASVRAAYKGTTCKVRYTGDEVEDAEFGSFSHHGDDDDEYDE